MGINKKFQAVIDSFPVTKSIKKELVLRINELVDDLKGGGGDTTYNKVISCRLEVDDNYDYKVVEYLDVTDHISLINNERDDQHFEIWCEQTVFDPNHVLFVYNDNIAKIEDLLNINEFCVSFPIVACSKGFITLFRGMGGLPFTKQGITSPILGHINK